MKDRMLKTLACTVFFLWILLFLSKIVYEKFIRFVYVDNRRMADNGTYLARQAGKLKKAGLNHGWYLSSSISFNGKSFNAVIYILRKM